MRERFGGSWTADVENVLLPFEPGHCPMAYFRETERRPDLGLTSRDTVRASDKSAAQGAWQFVWPAMDAFHEKGERIAGHAADSYRRIDIRQSARNLVVRQRDRIAADTGAQLGLEPGE